MGHPEAHVSPVRFALGKLLDRTLRGMFDGPTNVRVDLDLELRRRHRPVRCVRGSWCASARDDGGDVVAPVGDDRAACRSSWSARRRRGVGAAGERVDREASPGSPQAVPARCCSNRRPIRWRMLVNCSGCPMSRLACCQGWPRAERCGGSVSTPQSWNICYRRPSPGSVTPTRS